MAQGKLDMISNPGREALLTKRKMLWAWVQTLETDKAMAKARLLDMTNNRGVKALRAWVSTQGVHMTPLPAALTRELASSIPT
jgi:hypothetical protein